MILYVSISGTLEKHVQSKIIIYIYIPFNEPVQAELAYLGVKLGKKCSLVRRYHGFELCMEKFKLTS